MSVLISKIEYAKNNLIDFEDSVFQERNNEFYSMAENQKHFVLTLCWYERRQFLKLALNESKK